MIDNTVKSVKVGQTILISEQDADDTRRVKKNVPYEVIEVYSHHVIGRKKVRPGVFINRSFNYGDLIVLGLEKQCNELEVLKHTYQYFHGKRE